MNIESICSPYTNLASLTEVLSNSDPAFKRGVFDMCAAFNLKADVVERGAPSGNDVWLVTPSGWVAGRLMYHSEYKTGDREWYFKYASRAIRKAKSDSRSDRSSRAATKIKDLIRTLRLKKEIITDATAFEHEKRAVIYAMGCVQEKIDRHPKPKLVIDHDMVDSVARAALEGVSLPEIFRADIQQQYANFLKEKDTYEEGIASLKMFTDRPCTAVGMLRHNNTTHYYVGKVVATMTSRNDHKLELQGEVKRYTSLEGTGLEADAAIIRTYMQGRSERHYDDSNAFGLARLDKYYDEVEVATGYAGDTMLWALLPERV